MVSRYLLVTSQLHQNVHVKNNESASQEYNHGVSTVFMFASSLKPSIDSFVKLFITCKVKRHTPGKLSQLIFQQDWIRSAFIINSYENISVFAWSLQDKCRPIPGVLEMQTVQSPLRTCWYGFIDESEKQKTWLEHLCNASPHPT